MTREAINRPEQTGEEEKPFEILDASVADGVLTLVTDRGVHLLDWKSLVEAWNRALADGSLYDVPPLEEVVGSQDPG